MTEDRESRDRPPGDSGPDSGRRPDDRGQRPDDRGQRPDDRGQRRGGFRRRRPMPVSPFRDNRVDGVEIDLTIDYKNVELLRRCLNQAAKILPRRMTTLNAKRQRRLAKELKRARYLALIPYVNKGNR